jgi:hypothetical protein
MSIEFTAIAPAKTKFLILLNYEFGAKIAPVILGHGC